MTDRFEVVNEPVSLHDCCFEATVVDTAMCDSRGKPKPLCECGLREDAEMIAAALNGVFKMATVH